MRIHLRVAPLLLAALAAVASAQQRPPVRQLGPITAGTGETFANIGAIRALSTGGLLINDIPGRRVLLFDPGLASFTVVADSTSATATAYGAQPGAVVAYRGDSSIFIDPASVSMLVIDPAGKIGRVMAVPRAEDARGLGGLAGGTAVDPSGRLIYRVGARIQMSGPPRRIEGAAGAGGFAMPDIPDSAFVVRVDLASRKVDTVGFIRTPKVKMESRQDDRGNMTISSLINPLPVVDDWAVLPDGSVAFVRGRDYHVDWVGADGTKTSSPKIAFDWQRMTEDDKIAFIDSVKAARERLGANAPVPGGGGSPQAQIFIGTGGPGGGAPPSPGNRTGITAAPPMSFVTASELPDYKPPFFANSTRADRDGNLWIRTIPTAPIAGGPVYDVINRKGELIERVQIPPGRTVIGFGPGGAVFLFNRDGKSGTVEKASVR